MKITIVSLNFHPQIGGLENIMYGLACEWHQQGHEVTVFTVTPGESTGYGFTVIRHLSLPKLYRFVQESDIFFEANISLKTCLIGTLFRKRWLVTQQLTYTHVQRWQEVLKNRFTNIAHNISASRYIANTLKGKSKVIPNFYAPMFRRLPGIEKTKDIVFVGRLVSDKGADDLLKALGIMSAKGLTFNCTIVGDGPEKETLVQLVAKQKLEGRVTFSGALRGEELVRAMNEHKIMVVPSKWPEPFGIVALEGLACGCRMVCSEDGGLAEAVSDHGLLYPNNDIAALADAIETALQQGVPKDNELEQIDAYLNTRTSGAVSMQYMKLFLELKKTGKLTYE